MLSRRRSLIACCLVIASILACAAACGASPGGVRKHTGGGSWYPSDPDVLRKQVEHFLDAAGKPVDVGQPLGVLVPHAGYRYSGGVAARCGSAAPSIRGVLRGPSLWAACTIVGGGGTSAGSSGCNPLYNELGGDVSMTTPIPFHGGDIAHLNMAKVWA